MDSTSAERWYKSISAILLFFTVLFSLIIISALITLFHPSFLKFLLGSSDPEGWSMLIVMFYGLVAIPFLVLYGVAYTGFRKRKAWSLVLLAIAGTLFALSAIYSLVGSLVNLQLYIMHVASALITAIVTILISGVIGAIFIIFSLNKECRALFK